MQLEVLIGKDLREFEVVEFTEVYRVDDDGRKTKSVGFFRNETIAKAFAQSQVDKNWHQTGRVFVLTDGKTGFILKEVPITILDDEQATLEIRNKALSKLTPEERIILGIGI